MRILVTGSAGFIGSALMHALKADDRIAFGFDRHNTGQDITNIEHLKSIIAAADVDCIIHLAARAGVRSTPDSVMDYAHSNLAGQVAVLEACRVMKARLIYASSSSVYGDNAGHQAKNEYDELQPRSLYAATKAAGELLAQTYADQHQMDITGLRFFSVYGPHGREDMAPMIFARRLMAGKPIEIYGDCSRDFTYIGDVVSAIMTVLDNPIPGHHVYNVGTGQPHKISMLATALQDIMKIKTGTIFMAGKKEDASMTWANNAKLCALGWQPETSFYFGLANMVAAL